MDPDTQTASEATVLLESLLQAGVIDPLTFEAAPAASRAQLARFSTNRLLLARLVELKLLTSYQAERIRIGKVQGLILGAYRVLDRLAAGASGVVFCGEHRETGQKVAIKVLIPPRDSDPKPMLRFFAERKTVAQLCHPGIVHALDIGETTPNDPAEPVLYYYVMEHVPGLDLEQHVKKNGPLSPTLACEAAYQVSDALTEVHKHNLVHRDIKPSNIILTPEGRAMLLDFGLVRHCRSSHTVMGSLVGILEWIAPEQAMDAHAVDIRADLYSLGCTLFWCLTGQSPYRLKESPRSGPAQSPPSVRASQGDLDPALDAVVARMMAPLPDDRYPTPHAVMAALAPFVSEKFALAANILQPGAAPASQPARPTGSSTAHVLIVDDDAELRRTCRESLQAENIACDEAGGGELALDAIAAAMPDLVLLAVDLAGITGLELLKQLRQTSHGAAQRIIMLVDSRSDVRPLLAAGADDYLTKPIDRVRLLSRVKTALQLKQTHDASQEPPAGSSPVEERIEHRPAESARGRFWPPSLNWVRRRKV